MKFENRHEVADLLRKAEKIEHSMRKLKHISDNNPKCRIYYTEPGAQPPAGGGPVEEVEGFRVENMFVGGIIDKQLEGMAKQLKKIEERLEKL